jgi:hypothetical protein
MCFFGLVRNRLWLPALFALSGIALLHGQDARSGRVEVAVGDEHGVLLKSEGSVWTWGANNGALLGRDANNNLAPTQVPSLSSIRHIAAGADFTLALAADGAISTWGNNQPVPTPIAGLPRIVSIAAGGHHALALDSSGAVWSWGQDSGPHPTRVPTLDHVVAIAAGDQHSIALDAAGHVWVWGDHGISGIDGGSSTAPRLIPGLSNMTAVAGGEHITFGLRKDGTVWAINNPATAIGLAGVKAIAARQQTAIALKADGTIWTWGDNHYSQLGNVAIRPSDSSSKPVRVGMLTGISAISSGGDHLAAVTTSSIVWTWGRNQSGSLGVDPADIAESDVPVRPGQPVRPDPPACSFAPGDDAQTEVFACGTASRKLIQFCGDIDPDDHEKWINVNYRFGSEKDGPELIFPAHPESAPPSLFYSEEKQKDNDTYQVVRFSTGPYTYRVHWGWETAYFGDGTPAPRPIGVGWVDVDANGKRVTHIDCDVFLDRDLSRSLPRDPKAAIR